MQFFLPLLRTARCCSAAGASTSYAACLNAPWRGMYGEAVASSGSSSSLQGGSGLPSREHVEAELARLGAAGVARTCYIGVGTANVCAISRPWTDYEATCEGCLGPRDRALSLGLVAGNHLRRTSNMDGSKRLQLSTNVFRVPVPEHEVEQGEWREGSCMHALSYTKATLCGQSVCFVCACACMLTKAGWLYVMGLYCHTQHATS